MIRGDLRFVRLLAVWAPLAATFLLLSGSMPIVNASINRLPGRDHAADLAAFAVFLQCIIVLHGPLFVTREIAIKLSVDRAGARQALRFCAGVAAVIAAIELLMGVTPLGAWFLRAFTNRPSVVEEAHRAFLIIWPVPVLIAVRGVYQAHQIRVDDTLFVGLGTVLRLGLTALLGLLVAPRVKMSGATLGALCLGVGILTETVFAVVRARARARPPRRAEVAGPNVWRFGLALMFANVLGLLTSLFYLRIAGRLVPEEIQTESLASYQEVRTLAWLLTSGSIALQALVTAKVRTNADVGPMLRFSLVVSGALTAVLAVLAFTPLRDWVLVDLMNEEPGGLVLHYATPALMVASAMPLLSGVRFALRGVLISRGHTRAITGSNVVSLVLLSTAVAFDLMPTERNGALNAFLLWVLMLCLEIVILRFALRAPGPPADLPPPVTTAREASAG